MSCFHWGAPYSNLLTLKWIEQFRRNFGLASPLPVPSSPTRWVTIIFVSCVFVCLYLYLYYNIYIRLCWNFSATNTSANIVIKFIRNYVAGNGANFTQNSQFLAIKENVLIDLNWIKFQMWPILLLDKVCTMNFASNLLKQWGRWLDNRIITILLTKCDERNWLFRYAMILVYVAVFIACKENFVYCFIKSLNRFELYCIAYKMKFLIFTLKFLYYEFYVFLYYKIVYKLAVFSLIHCNTISYVSTIIVHFSKKYKKYILVKSFSKYMSKFQTIISHSFVIVLSGWLF